MGQHRISRGIPDETVKHKMYIVLLVRLLIINNNNIKTVTYGHAGVHQNLHVGVTVGNKFRFQIKDPMWVNPVLFLFIPIPL